MDRHRCSFQRAIPPGTKEGMVVGKQPDVSLY